MNQQVEVFYVGQKKAKRDTVAGTNLIWHGFGASLLVERMAAQQLLNFPSVWVDAKTFAEKYSQSDGDHSSSGLAAVIEEPQATTEPEPAPANSLALIQEAIRGLDRTNTDHFGSNGAPKIDAVRSQLPEGFGLDAKTLNQAFSEIKDEFRA